MIDQGHLRTPLGRVVGLGSAHEGVQHWWAQRVTAVPLVPLLLWLVISLVRLVGASRGEIIAWLHAPFPAIALVLLLAAGFYHMVLGLQVVIEDYIHAEGAKIALLVLNRLAGVTLTVTGIYAVLRLALLEG